MTPLGMPSAAELAQAALRGDSLAWSGLIALLLPSALCAARPIVGTEANAERIANETMRIVCTSLGRLRDLGRIVRWTRRISQNLARKQRAGRVDMRRNIAPSQWPVRTEARAYALVEMEQRWARETKGITRR